MHGSLTSLPKTAAAQKLNDLAKIPHLCDRGKKSHINQSTAKWGFDILPAKKQCNAMGKTTAFRGAKRVKSQG